MKKILSLIVVFAGLLVLSACQDKKGYTYDFSKTQVKTETIKVWLDDTDGNWANELIDEFNKIHPEIVVEFQHMSTVDAESRLSLYGPSGNGADIFQFPHDHLASALQADLLYALPQTFVDDNLKDRMSEKAMDIATVCYDFQTKSFACKADGSNKQVFGAPLSLETVALFYNKALTKDINGGQVFTSFEDLLSAAQTYDNIGTNKFLFLTNYNDSYFMNFAFTAFGFQPFGPNHNDPTKPNINSPEMINALTWVNSNLKPLYGADSHNDTIQALGSKFESGELPYYITGPWSIESYKNKGLDFGVTTIPTIKVNGVDVNPSPFAGAQMAGIYKYSQHKEAAQKFLSFMVSNKGLEIMYRVKGKLPALKDELLVNVPGVDDDQYLKGIREELQYAMPMPTIPEVQSYWEPVRQMVMDVWNNNMTPTAAATKAETAYDALVDTNNQ